MKKTIAYIDGYNLYYGLLKSNPKSKWLDLSALVKKLLRPDHDIVGIKFFTARIRPYPQDLASIERQKIYLQALTSLKHVEIVEGFYNKKKTWAPHVNAKCRDCNESRYGMARVVKLEEKRSDVNLAVNAMLDAARNKADCFMIISGDSDQAGTIEALRYEFGKSVLVFNPHTTVSEHLKRISSYYAHIQPSVLAECQMPDVVSLASGRTIHRPPAWT